MSPRDPQPGPTARCFSAGGHGHGLSGGRTAQFSESVELGMDAKQSHSAFAAISKRASKATEIFSGNNRRSWAVCSFGVLYLMYRTGRAMWTFEKSPDLRGMMSRIIFIAILCAIWVLTREKQREIRFGKSVKALKDFSFSSIKDLANRKKRPNQPTKAFRPKFRGGSM